MAGLKGYLLDTNVISETVRREPSTAVLRWLDSLEPEQLHVSVLSLGEIRKGALTVSDRRRRTRLLEWLDGNLQEWFEDRVLSVDAQVCVRWAELLAQTTDPLPAIDSLLAATALHSNLMVATRNTRDFSRLKVTLFNPWEF